MLAEIVPNSIQTETTIEKASQLKPVFRPDSNDGAAVYPRSWASLRLMACRQTMAHAAMSIDDIDHVEINEAFAVYITQAARKS